MCEWPALDPGQVVTAILHTTPSQTGIATNSATIGALGITDPVPGNNSATDIDTAGIAHHRVGDCVAARRASLAIYEGRRLALSL